MLAAWFPCIRTVNLRYMQQSRVHTPIAYVLLYKCIIYVNEGADVFKIALYLCHYDNVDAACWFRHHRSPSKYIQITSTWVLLVSCSQASADSQERVVYRASLLKKHLNSYLYVYMLVGMYGGVSRLPAYILYNNNYLCACSEAFTASAPSQS